MYEFRIKEKYFKLVFFNRNIISSSLIKSNYYKWFHDLETTKYNSHGLFPQSIEETEKFLKAQDKKNDNSIHFAILSKIYEHEDFIHVGNASLQSIDWINRSAELAIVLGENDYRGIGLGQKICCILLEHGFEKLNLHRIWTGTAAINIAMNKIAQNLGMEREGIFKQGMFLHGEYIDINCYAILANNFFIKKEAGFYDK